MNDDPALRAGHRWGDKKVGIVDFALISNEPAKDCFEGVRGRLEEKGVGVNYEQPAAGGRTRDDGEVLKWEVTVPESPAKRGELPFFCHDVTSRELRVPREKRWITHPSKATGVSGLTIYVSKERVEVLKKAYPAITGVEESGKKGVFEIRSLSPVEGEGKAVLKILEPTDVEKRRVVTERGVLLDDLEIGITDSSDDTNSTNRFEVGL